MKEDELSERETLREEAKRLHGLLWTRAHHKAAGSTPPDIFSKSDADGIPEIALLSPDEILEKSKEYINPDFDLSHFYQEPDLPQEAFGQYRQQLADFSQVLDYLEENKSFTPEELTNLRKNWENTCEEFFGHNWRGFVKQIESR